MKIFATTFLVCAAVTLSGCNTDTEMTDAPKSEEAMAMAVGTVVDPLIGKRLVSEAATFIINADGTMGGEIRGEAIVGTYVANATETCSTYSAPEFLTGRDWCSVPEIDGDTVIFNRRDGTTSPAYAIQG